MLPRAWLASAATRLAEAGTESPEANARQLLEHVSGLSRLQLLTGNTPLEDDVLARLEELLGRRLQGIPLQHLTGVSHFYGLELSSSAAALVPRPETEVLVELALQAIRDVKAPRVIDIGTGTGAIALAIAAERPDATVMATDVSADALQLAAGNDAGGRLTLVRSDLLQHPAVREFTAQADLLVSNPPYLPESDRQIVSTEVRHDPPGALYAGEDGLDLVRRLVPDALGLMAPGSVIMLELDPRNVKLAQAEFGGSVHQDLAGRERFLKLSVPG